VVPELALVAVTVLVTGVAELVLTASAFCLFDYPEIYNFLG